MATVVKQVSYIITFMEHVIYRIKQEISNVKQTLGVEFSSKIMQINQKKIRMQMWDTAGQERIQSIDIRDLFQVLDITEYAYRKQFSTASFEALPEWIKYARDYSKPSVQIIIIGNKADLDKERTISQQSAKQFCLENEVQYIETSAIEFWICSNKDSMIPI
ncbi:unnamed protein product (macronuclear) [Paramecium tetraurelia]|uniref:Uncharacterized protein n=1 Tax=Paramecium tetraurelia TaxID=5888 RepID=A0CS66_PARTE|nr:uncharacterized protein GSPATT00009905001 [Paramecium tetraurelia]CAK73633.1 unnamed protein product [Paramecium tetraurelia]|eukprot:XP_001441030.1 hypothetical protein (macronuclear) [Paramecium tetraurelia strain d4-2]